jgi:formiminotetrahydrofolate cyclodeaminase
MILDQSVHRFLDELASSAPTPGGGSAAAVMGAMGAALLSMVCRLTVGKKDYESVEASMREALARSESLREQLTAMVAADVQVFEALMAAYKLPRSTDPEKLARGQAIQEALKQATDVPLECAAACAEVLGLSRQVALQGHRSVISDAGVAALVAHAALRSAALNVFINVPSIQDAEFVRSRGARLDALLAQCSEASEQVYQTVLKRLA